jgi:hypothetical protein
MPLKRFTKTEELIGIEFDGSEESAKEIVEWVKSIVGDQYQRGQMQRGHTQFHLGYDVGQMIPEAVLLLTIDSLPGTYHLNVPAGALVVYDPTELEVRFLKTSPDGLRHWKRETVDGNVQED